MEQRLLQPKNPPMQEKQLTRSFSAELSIAAHEENNKSISSYRQNGKNPAQNPKPDGHWQIQNFELRS